MTEALPWDDPRNRDEDGFQKYGSLGPMPCDRLDCGHDVVSHISHHENSRCVRCDCPAFIERISEGIDWANINDGVCPRCREVKFIGHGPLCSDCYLGATDPTTARGENQ